MVKEKLSFVCVKCGKTFSGHKTVCRKCKKIPDKIGPNGEPIKICPNCGKEHISTSRLFCSKFCAQARKQTEESNVRQRQALINYHQTPEAVGTRNKLARFNVVTKGEGKEFNEVSIDDFVVNLPDIREIEDFGEFHEGYERGESW